VQRYENKVAIITGGGGAIGGAIARRLSSEGAAVAVLDQLGDQAERMATELETGGGKAIALVADITDKPAVEAAVAATFEAYGRIDLLVNNAGYTKSGSIADLNPDEFNKELNINLTGSYICAAAVLPTMIEAGRGAIVNIGSVNGQVAVGNPGVCAQTWSRPAPLRPIFIPGACDARKIRKSLMSWPVGIRSVASASRKMLRRPWRSWVRTKPASSTAST